MSPPTLSAGAATVLALGYALYAGNLTRHHARYWDDAFITFRFAERLAAGDGLVWNTGGERVEGYTSFLHVLLLAVASRAGLRPETAALALSFAATIAASVVMLVILRRHAGPLTVLSALPVAVFLATEPTAIHSTSRLETPLFVLCLTVSVASALRLIAWPRWRTAIALAVASLLGILCRPEAALLNAGVYAALVGCGILRRRSGGLQIVRMSAASGVVLAALIGLYAAAKFAYFGYLLPNPYYVKSNRLALAGVSEVGRFVEYVAWRLGPVLALALAALYAAGSGLKRVNWTRIAAPAAILSLPAALGIGFYMTIIHEVGGAHRFSYPLLVYLALLTAFIVSPAAAELSTLTKGSQRWVKAAMPAAAIIGLLALQPSFDFRPLARGEFNDYHLRIAEALRETGLGASATVLTDAAGVIPYVSGFNQLDRIGLTDNHLSGRVPLSAAERERYVWSRAPDVYIGYEPRASAGTESAAADQVMRTPYVADILMKRRLFTIEDRIFVQDEALLHARMRELRDHWIWLGEMEWPGWRLWRLKSFVYVRKTANPLLAGRLRVLVIRGPEAVRLDDVARTAN